MLALNLFNCWELFLLRKTISREDSINTKINWITFND
nr:MAG TPA: hypothetical protein [Caudoviricetes sp.]